MPDKRNVIATTIGAAILAVVLLFFKTPYELVAGMLVAVTLGTVGCYSTNPSTGVFIPIVMSCVITVLGGGIYLIGQNHEASMFLFGLGGFLGSWLNLFFDAPRTEIIKYLQTK